MMKRILLGGLALSGTCLAPLAAPAMAEEAADHYYWRPAADDGRPRPWAVILPGGGGMEVFGDTQHYFRWAEWLNARGIDVLLVHHQAAGEYLADVQQEHPGETQARVVSHAVAHERALGRMDQRCSGVVLGWSFGGAGALEVAARGSEGLPGLAAAVGFYPLVTFHAEGYRAQVPVLVLQGSIDDTTPPEALDHLLANSGPSEIDVSAFDNAHHAFDVEGLREPVSWNGGTFLYNAEAARGAAEELDAWLTHRGLTGTGACALD